MKALTKFPIVKHVAVATVTLLVAYPISVGPVVAIYGQCCMIGWVEEEGECFGLMAFYRPLYRFAPWCTHRYVHACGADPVAHYYLRNRYWEPQKRDLLSERTSN